MNKKGKLLLSFLALFLLVGVGLVIWSNYIRRAEAAWFDDLWAYRQAVTVTVTSSATDITNLETILTIDTTGITAKLQTSCQDFRFVSQSGNSLPYYFSSCSDNSATNKVWVLVDLVPKNTTTYTLYMYYGNPTASSLSDRNSFDLLTHGLIGYWPMNETSWTVDCSTGSVIDASITGTNGKSCPTSTGPAGGATGQYSYSGSFDGSNDYVDLSNAATFDGATKMTWSYWVKPSTPGGDTAMLAKFNTGPTETAFLFRTGGADQTIIRAQIAISPTDGGTTYGDTPTGAIPNTQWTHVVIVFDGAGSSDADKLKIYANNSAQSLSFTGTMPTSLQTTTSNFVVGSSSNGSISFSGQIDDVRIYRRALSSSDVSNLYSSPGPTASAPTATFKPSTSFGSEEKSPVPLAYWKFDDGSGTVAKNSVATISATLAASTATPTWQTEDMCVSGRCLLFDGSDDYASSTNQLDLAQTNVVTVEFWLKWNAYAEDDKKALEFSANYTTSTTGFAVIPNDSATGQFKVAVRGDGGTNSVEILRPSANDWHHYAFVLDKSAAAAAEVTPYVDGKLVSYTKANSTNNTNNFGLNFLYFMSRAGTSGFGKGFIDEPKIYSYARSVAEIKANYNSKKAALAKGAGTSLGVERNAALNQGLIGYWKMDENTGTSAVDSSGNAKTLTLNSASWTGVGKFGSAWNGTGSVWTSQAGGDDPHFDFAAADKFTISIWFKTDSTSNPAANENIVSKSGSGIGYQLVGRTTGEVFFGIDSSGGGGLEDRGCQDGRDRYDAQWHLFTVVKDGASEMRCYVDGALMTTITLTQTGTLENTGTFRVGDGSGADDGDEFTGDLDEVRVYRRALTGFDVQTLYNFGPGPILKWNFEEGIGTSVGDSSGNGYTGTWTGTGSRWSTGYFGKGGIFNGVNNYVSRNNMLPASRGTIEFWFKFNRQCPNTGLGVGSNTRLFSDSGGYVFVDCTTSSRQLTFELFDTTDRRVQLTTGLSLNQWYHIAGTWDGSRMQVYLNGVYQGNSVMGTLGSTAGTIALGAFPVDGTNAVPANMDELQIYNYPRTQQQVVADMNGGHPIGGSPFGSAANYWKFDEGQGTVANNSGTHGDVGVLTSMSSPASVGISGWNPNGKFGKAISFDGSNDLIDFNDMSHLEAVSTMSATFWVNPVTLATQRCFLCKYQNTAAANKRTFAIESGSAASSGVIVEVSTDGNTGVASGETPSGQLTAGTWTHVAVVYDGGQAGNDNRLKIYVNGVRKTLSFSGTLPSAFWASTSDLMAGASSDATPARLFTGSMDEIKIYTLGLTSQDVLIDYNRGQSVNFGVLGTSTADGKTASSSAGAAYCVPGDTTSCNLPVGEWKMEQGAGSSVNDTSGRATTGTITGATWTQGKNGKGVQMSGANDKVDFGDTSFTDSLAAMTFSLWMKPLSVVATRTIFSKYDAVSSNFATRTTIASASEIHVFIMNATGDQGDNYFTTTGLGLSAGDWTNLTIVYDGTLAAANRVAVYKNGVKIPGTVTGTLPATMTSGSTANLQLGMWGYALLGEALQSKYDEVKMYNYARTPAQIAYEYNRGLPVSWWKLDECQGLTLNSSSGSASGTLTVGATDQAAAGTCVTSATTVWYNGRTGKYNASINLDGDDDYGQTGNLALIIGNGVTTTKASWGGWFKPTGTAASKTLIHKNNELRLTTTAGSIPQCEVYSGSWQTAAVAVNALTLSAWHHLVCIYDGTEIKLYVNGLQAAVRAETASLTGTANSFTVGRDSAANSQFYEGQVDEVKLWNYPLTSNQVRNDFNQGGAVRFGPVTGAP